MSSVGTLILSPHSDDAVLSLGAAIAAGSLPQPVTVATVFGRSSFTQDTGPSGDIERVTAVRRAEDEAYASRRGLKLAWLNQDEALLRLGWHSIFRGREPQPPALDVIRAALRSLDTALVIAPLGLGHHADHIALATIARDVAAGRPLAYYEDLPYAAKLSRRALTAGIARVDPALIAFDLRATPPDFETKLADVASYASQIAPWMLRALRRHARGGVERVWADPRAAALLSNL